MAESMLFLLGFSAISAVYEISKTGKSIKSDKMRKNKDTFNRFTK